MRIKENVFGLGVRVICRGLLYTLISPMRNASARGLAMKVSFNNNLQNQTNDAMVNPQNPVNPDSNNWLLRA